MMRDLSQRLQHSGAVTGQVLQIVAAHGELIERVAQPAADAHVLRRLQIERGARNPASFGRSRAMM